MLAGGRSDSVVIDVPFIASTPMFVEIDRVEGIAQIWVWQSPSQIGERSVCVRVRFNPSEPFVLDVDDGWVS